MFLRILDRLEEILIATLIGGATLVIFVAVVQRYALGVPFLYPLLYNINLTWAQELCIYMDGRAARWLVLSVVVVGDGTL